MLYLLSVALEVQGWEAILHGESDSRTGPIISEGQIIDSAFSRCMVNRRLVPVCKDSSEEAEDIILDGP